MRSLVRVRRLLNSLLNLLFSPLGSEPRTVRCLSWLRTFADPDELSKKIGFWEPLARLALFGPYRD